MKNIYFISDAHLGSLAIKHRRTQERRLVNFLDAIKDKAEAIYMLGDMFDFWFEYADVVPKGYTRFLGKISELTDRGVEVHFLEPYTCEICGKEFFIAHGDGLDYQDHNWKTEFLFACFKSRTLKRLAQMIHPHLFIPFGLKWAKHSRMKREEGGEPPYKGENEEGLVLFAKDYLKTHPSINYFMFGHRHIELDLILNKDSRVMLMGEWISLFT